MLKREGRRNMRCKILLMALTFALCVFLIRVPTTFAGARIQGENACKAGGEAVFGQVLAREARIKCSVNVKYPLPGKGGMQTVYIRVTDGAGRGVAGASVRVLVRQRSGDRWLWAPATNAFGDSVCSFPLNNELTGGIVWVEVVAQWRGSQARARTSYVSCW